MTVNNSTSRQSTAIWLCVVLLLPSFAFAVAELMGVASDVFGGQHGVTANEGLGLVAFIGALLAPFGFLGAVIVSVFVAFANKRDGARSPRLWVLMGIGLLLQFLIYEMLH